jgi:hypothetical protein
VDDKLPGPGELAKLHPVPVLSVDEESSDQSDVKCKQIFRVGPRLSISSSFGSGSGNSRLDASSLWGVSVAST